MGPFVAIDFETSGRGGHSACSVGLVRLEGGRVAATWSSLIRPPSPKVEFTWVHGLTWPMLKDAPSFPQVWPAMAAFMEGAEGLVAHNATFDRGVLESCRKAFGCGGGSFPFYCTLRGARAVLDLPSYRLNVVSEHYGIPLRHHEALSDAMACALIFLRLLEEGLPAESMRLEPPRPRAPRQGRGR